MYFYLTKDAIIIVESVIPADGKLNNKYINGDNKNKRTKSN